MNADCVYEAHFPHQSLPHPVRRDGTGISQTQGSPSTTTRSEAPSHGSEMILTSLSNGSTSITSQPSAWDVDFMRERIRQLEWQLSQTNQTPNRPPKDSPAAHLEPYSSSIGGTWYMNNEVGTRPVIRGITHKTRQFGQTHWVNMVTLVSDFICIGPQYSHAKLGSS